LASKGDLVLAEIESNRTFPFTILRLDRFGGENEHHLPTLGRFAEGLAAGEDSC
jgi:hypothetical protein